MGQIFSSRYHSQEEPEVSTHNQSNQSNDSVVVHIRFPEQTSQPPTSETILETSMDLHYFQFLTSEYTMLAYNTLQKVLRLMCRGPFEHSYSNDTSLLDILYSTNHIIHSLLKEYLMNIQYTIDTLKKQTSPSSSYHSNIQLLKVSVQEFDRKLEIIYQEFMERFL
jgi:hypothetical protein